MATRCTGILGTTMHWVVAIAITVVIGVATSAGADLTIGGTVVTSLDPSQILISGLDGVTIKVEGTGGSFEATTATNVVAGLWTLSVPEGTYVVTPCMTGKTFEHVTGSTPDGNRTWQITVDQAHLAENQSIKFLASDGTDGPDAGQSQVDASPATVGLAVQSTITITAKDVCGNTLEGIAAGEVVVAASPAGGALVQPASATDASGQTTATFSSTTSGTYTISVTISGTAVTDTATVEVEGEKELEFTVQPGGPYEAGEQFSVEVTVTDDQGRVDTTFSGSVALALASNPGNASLSGTATKAVSSGVASFSGLSINKTGTGYTLLASVTGATSATSSAFNVEAGAAADLAFVTQPGSGAVGAVISPSPQVGLYDDLGNLVSDANTAVTVQLTGGPGGAVLSGTSTVNAVNGVATFSTLTINLEGEYQLTATSGGLTSATSQSFGLDADPILDIEQADDADPVDPNDSITYTVTYGNSGAADAINTVIVEVLPAGLTYVSATGGGVYEAATRTITWTIGTIPALTPGKRVTYTATVNGDLSDGGTIINDNLTIDCDDVDAVQAPTETTTVNDVQGPGIAMLAPNQGDVQVPLNNIVKVRITDGNEVDFDGDTVEIYIEGDLIYDGGNESPIGVYDTTGTSQTIRGVCKRTGTATAYAFTFVPSPSALYGYEKKLDVVVSASDGSGNETEASFYFWTMMRSFGANGKVNSDTGTLVQDNPSTACDSQGNIWVVWDQTNVGGDRDIYVGTLPVDSSSFNASVAVAGTTNDECKPRIAIDGSDVAHVVWQADDPNGHWDIYTASSSDGTTWSTSAKVSVGDPNNTSNQMSPTIGIDRDTPNSIFVAWEDYRNGNSDIWLGSSAGGGAWTERRLTTSAAAQTHPVIVVDAENVVYVAWKDATDTGTGTDIYGASSDNGPWTAVKLVDAAGDQSSPAGAVSELVHLLWVSDASGYADIIYGNDANMPITGTSIIDEPNTVQSTPALAVKSVDDSDTLFACWTDARNVVNGNGDTDIYFAESSSPFGTNTLVNDDTGTAEQSKPSIGVDADGNPYMVWADARNGNMDIYYAGSTSLEPVSRFVEESGGVVTVTCTSISNLQVICDVNALPEGVDGNDITISEIAGVPELPPRGFGVVYEFGPSGAVFSSPITIRIPLVDDPGYDRYMVYVYDPDTGLWTQDGVHNPARKVTNAGGTYLEVQVDHFSVFGVSGTNAGGGGGGGCALAPWSRTRPVEFMLPFMFYALALAGVTAVDRRRRLRERR